MKWFILILLIVVLLAILVPVIRLGIAALGTPGDRARANVTGANTRGTGARPNTGPSRATWATSNMR